MMKIQVRIISLVAVISTCLMFYIEFRRRNDSPDFVHWSNWKPLLIYRILFFLLVNLILSFKQNNPFNLVVEIFCIGWVIGEFVYWGSWSSDLIHRMLPEHDRLVTLYDGDWVAVALLFSVIYLFGCLINKALSVILLMDEE